MGGMGSYVFVMYTCTRNLCETWRNNLCSKSSFPKQARSANHGIVQEPSTGKSSEEDRQYLSHCALLPKSYFASRPPACLCWLYGRRRARGYPATRPMLVTILLKSSQYFIIYLLYLTIRSWYVLFLAPNALHAVTHSARLCSVSFWSNLTPSGSKL